MKFSHVMIDLETIGHLKGDRVPVVTEAGIVFFDMDPNVTETHSTKIIFSVEKSIDGGLVYDEDTVEWWMGENPTAFNNMMERDGVSPLEGIVEISILFRENATRNPCVWAKSPSFDCSILSAIARTRNFNLPWKFYQERDVRTAAEMSGIPDKRFPGSNHYGVLPLGVVEGGVHDSIFDSMRQAEIVRCAFSRFKKE